MSIQACAELVQRGDPDRFLAAMAVPVAARAVLFPIYAFNLEVARAPWVTQEPMIAEMRLQWWRDALEEIAQGGPVRRHEVATPLAEVLDAEGAGLLDALVEARRWDIAREPFAGVPALEAYLEATSGHLAWAAARALGAAEGEAAFRDMAYAAGLANWLLAAPSLAAAGVAPLPEAAPEAIADLAWNGLRRWRKGRGLKLPKRARPAALAFWRAPSLLRQAAKDPDRVLGAGLAQSEFARRGGLLLHSFRL
ncbi:MAG: squalene/phytoene synthase family protein [Rhodobacteraceae bacterium]|nr:squalene/phytoene synthase family protein [Paracoccaceae bacterium]